MYERIETMAANEEQHIYDSIDFHRLYKELMEELDQARRERAELIKLIKDLRLSFENEPRRTQAPQSPRQVPDTNGLRVGLFVDVQNIFYNARNFYGRKLDFKKLIDLVGNNRVLVTAVAYLVFAPDVDQTNFITMLQQNGYIVREKTHFRADDTFAPSEYPAPMCADVRENLDGLDLAVLVGVDNEMINLIHDIQDTGIKVELYGFAQNIDEELAQVANTFHVINESLLLGQEFSSRPPQTSPYRGSRNVLPTGQRDGRTNVRTGYSPRSGMR